MACLNRSAAAKMDFDWILTHRRGAIRFGWRGYQMSGSFVKARIKERGAPIQVLHRKACVAVFYRNPPRHLVDSAAANCVTSHSRRKKHHVEYHSSAVFEGSDLHPIATLRFGVFKAY